MAPQKPSQKGTAVAGDAQRYGAVQFEGDTFMKVEAGEAGTPSRGRRRGVITASAVFVAVAVAAVLWLGSSRHTGAPRALVDQAIETPDESLISRSDCACTSACQAEAGRGAADLKYCYVAETDCMGIDYNTPTKIDPSADCGATNCYSVCQLIDGHYDCWQFPCHNGGFCVDGQDSYQCHCATGYIGENCDDDIDECAAIATASSPAVCSDSAVCSNTPGAYFCDCKTGFQGDGYTPAATLATPEWVDRSGAGNIEGCVDIDECAGAPCMNGGTCRDLGRAPIPLLSRMADKYICDCTAGWEDLNCDSDIDECETGTHNCDKHARCTNVPGSFLCECHEHWVGNGTAIGNEAGCEDEDDCGKSPCLYGGTCSEGYAGCEHPESGEMHACYFCVCTRGWTGTDCETDMQECVDEEDLLGGNDCHSDAACQNTPGSHTCSCNAGFTGDGNLCWDADDCEFSPCGHGGTCMDCGKLCFTCDCVVGWSGNVCEKDWDECTKGIHECHDDATCVNTPGSYDCVCDPGFTGDGLRVCTDINDCDPAAYGGNAQGPCVHGTCRDVGANAFLCQCTAGWIDSNCDRNINECDPVLGDNHCSRFSKCEDTDGSYTCTCNAGYAGDGHACVDVSDCGEASCVNGFCIDAGANNFVCKCDAGWQDELCDMDVNECMNAKHNCHEKAECVNTLGSYTCTCLAGFQGSGVQGPNEQDTHGCDDLDDCASDPCDSGECTDTGGNSYTCECDDGWTDFNCDYDVDECYIKIHNCHEDARCVNKPGTFDCRCLSGWKGDGLICVDVDDCDPDPCHPVHGSCEDMGANYYFCHCDAGWGNIHCDEDVNECATDSHACDPHAACTNTEGSHTCECEAEWYGDGTVCTPCTVCTDGEYASESVGGPICGLVDRTCTNINECYQLTHNCASEVGVCTDTEGSFQCECDIDQHMWGDGVTCDDCAPCGEGYYMEQACTSTTDAICHLTLRTGLYYITSEADDTPQCVVLDPVTGFPARTNFCQGGAGGCEADKFCGAGGPEQLLEKDEAVWRIEHLSGGLYTISSQTSEGWKCLFFGDYGEKKGSSLYPTLQGCQPGDDTCPWGNFGDANCGYVPPGGTGQVEGLVTNGQAVFDLTPLDAKQALQSGDEDQYATHFTVASNADGKGLQCLMFQDQGHATNPSRYNWGNGGPEKYCGVGAFTEDSPEDTLLDNGQAVFGFHYIGPEARR